MASKLLLSLALAASCTASALPRASTDNPHKAFVKYPITRQQRSLPRLRRDLDVPLYNVTSISYLIQLSIGTPGQEIKVAIDTGSDELWVNPDCSSSGLTTGQAQECFANEEYRPSKSETAEILDDTNEIQYGKGYVELEYVRDTISLPDSTISVKNSQFGVATSSQDLNEGIMGLGFGNGFNLNYNNFIDDLAEQNVTNSKAFSVALGSVEDDTGGTLIFGGVDTKKFIGPLVGNEILGPQANESLNRYWVQMTGLSLSKSGNDKQYSGTNLAVVLDSGSSLSYLPPSVVRELAADLDASFDSSGLFLVDCSLVNDRGSVDFSFGKITIKVPFKEFIWQFDSRTCILGAVPMDPNSGITALLGDTFMRSAYVVFDQTQKVISMAQSANCGENELTIPAGGVAAGNFTGQCTGEVADNDDSAAGRAALSRAALVGGLLVGLVMSSL